MLILARISITQQDPAPCTCRGHGYPPLAFFKKPFSRALYVAREISILFLFRNLVRHTKTVLLVIKAKFLSFCFLKCFLKLLTASFNFEVNSELDETAEEE